MAEYQPQVDSLNDDDQLDSDLMGQKSRRTKTKPAELNLASMIDVVFLLLIYFVITANFTIDEGVLITKLPEASESPATDDPDEPLQINLEGAYNAQWVRVNVSGRPVENFTELREYLEGLQYNPDRQRMGHYRPDYPVRVHPDRFVRWQHVMNAFNAALRAQYTDVGFPPGGPEN